MAKKWCVGLSGNGWGFDLHPYRGEQDIGTDVFDSFREAKKECLNRYRDFLLEVKEQIQIIKKQRAK